MSALLGHRGFLLTKALPPPIPARYWRLLITAANGAAFVEVNELTMREQPGQPPVAAGGTGLIWSSAAVKAFYAFDMGFYGPNTAWRSVSNPASSPEYIGRDYQGYPTNKTTLRQIEVKCSPNTDAAPKDFRLEYSDDLSLWVSVLEVSGQENWAANENRIFTV